MYVHTSLDDELLLEIYDGLGCLAWPRLKGREEVRCMVAGRNSSGKSLEAVDVRLKTEILLERKCVMFP